MRTDVVVKALSIRAENLLLKYKAEEEALQKKYGSVFGVLKLKRLPSETQKHITARLLTQHAFYRAKEDNVFAHRIIGRTILNERERVEMRDVIIKNLLEDGLESEEFEVVFCDE